MTLRDFLQERQHDSRGGAEQRRRIEAYSAAVKTLMGRFKEVLRPYDALQVEEWLPLLKEHAVPYNAPALTISFGDEQIDIQPKGALVMDSEGRVAMTRGVREVHLDWAGSDDWTFRWVTPRTSTPERLTDQAIEDLVQGLLA
jgi:hypothetical protein